MLTCQLPARKPAVTAQATHHRRALGLEYHTFLSAVAASFLTDHTGVIWHSLRSLSLPSPYFIIIRRNSIDRAYLVCSTLINARISGQLEENCCKHCPCAVRACIGQPVRPQKQLIWCIAGLTRLSICGLDEVVEHVLPTLSIVARLSFVFPSAWTLWKSASLAKSKYLLGPNGV